MSRRPKERPLDGDQSYINDLDETKDLAENRKLFRLPRTRSRHVPHSSVNVPFHVDWIKKTDGSLYLSTTPWGNYTARNSEVETCVDSVRNPNYNLAVYGEPLDTGGELLLKRNYWGDECSVNHNERYNYSSIYWQNVYGLIGMAPIGFVDNHGVNPTSLNPTLPSSDTDFSSYGASAWNRYKPAKPSTGMLQFIIEAKDLPRLLKARLDGIKTISDVYLAATYGWGPLLSDIKAMLHYVDKVNEAIDFFYRNAGKVIRRKGPVDHTIVNDVVQDLSGQATYCGLTTRLNGRLGYPANYSKCRTVTVRTVERTVWFSGGFVFWFNGKPPSRTTLAARLLGLQVTPALIWEVLPWSWLIDWFYNIGDVLNNLTTEVADNQASTYAYIMGHTKRKYSMTGTDGIKTASVSRVFEAKVRQKVHPFGLASADSPLSTRQLSILAALGVQRGT
jgi:hypothetical protein